MQNKRIPAYIEIIGWYGPVALVLAYALASFNVIEVKGYAFQLLNLTGAIAIIVISLVKRVYQLIALNLFWSVIAIVMLVQLLVGR